MPADGRQSEGDGASSIGARGEPATERPAATDPADARGPVPAEAAPEADADPAGPAASRPAALVFDRHMVLESLGGWRGMLDTSLPTVAFIVGNSVGGLRPGIWAAVAVAVLIFGVRLARRQSVQQAISGLFAVVVAVAIAAYSGQARDYFVLGIVRNAAIGVALLGSIPLRWPLVGVVAEFLAPSHLGSLASHSLPSLLRGPDRTRPGLLSRPAPDPRTGRPPADPPPERHWRDDRRLVRAYGWLTVLWAFSFLVRALVSGVFYKQDAVGWLGVTTLLLGLPLTAVVLAVTLVVVAGLHRHRAPPSPEPTPDTED